MSAEGPDPGGTVLVAAFEGWSDTAEAASTAVEHLLDAWQAVDVHEMDTESYYDYQVLRPVITINDGVVRELRWRGSRIASARLPEASTRVLLLTGAEPSFRWKSFCDEVLEIAETHDVSRAVLLGAFPAAAAHSRPIPIVGSASEAATARELGFGGSDYEGVTSVSGALSAVLAAGGIPTVSLWAAVPYYTSDLTCHKAALALLRRVEDVLDITVPFGDLVESSRDWEQEIDAQVRDDEELAEFVGRMEAQAPLADMREASGDEIAREFERYLRRQGRGDAQR